MGLCLYIFYLMLDSIHRMLRTSYLNLNDAFTFQSQMYLNKITYFYNDFILGKFVRDSDGMRYNGKQAKQIH